MKKLVKLLSIVTMAAAGAFAIINSKPKQKAENASAENWHNNPTIFFVPSNNWTSNGGERFKLNYYDGGTYKGSVEMSLEGTGAAKGLFYGRKVYKAQISSDRYTSRIQIIRLASDYSTQWNYSGTIYLTASANDTVLMMDATCSNWDDWTTDTSGVWLNCVQDYSVYKSSDYSPSSSTGRVFFNNSGTHWADNSNYKGCAVYAWGGDASPKKWTTGTEVYSATVYHLTWFNDDNGMSYGYADIPLNASGYKFVRTTIADEYTTGLGYFSSTEFIIDSFAYVRYGLSSGNDINSAGAKDDVAGANLMKKVIEAYNTCSSSVLNGYGAYDALNNNFLSHATAAAKSATGTSLGGNSATIQDHFDAMYARSTRGGSSGSPLLSVINENTQSITIIVLVSLVSVTAIGGYFFIRRRKETN